MHITEASVKTSQDSTGNKLTSQVKTQDAKLKFHECFLRVGLVRRGKTQLFTRLSRTKVFNAQRTPTFDERVKPHGENYSQVKLDAQRRWFTTGNPQLCTRTALYKIVSGSSKINPPTPARGFLRNKPVGTLRSPTRASHGMLHNQQPHLKCKELAAATTLLRKNTVVTSWRIVSYCLLFMPI